MADESNSSRSSDDCVEKEISSDDIVEEPVGGNRGLSRKSFFSAFTDMLDKSLSSASGKGPMVSSSFIQGAEGGAEGDDDFAELVGDAVQHRDLRLRFWRFMTHPATELSMGCLYMVDFANVWIDADVRAKGSSTPEELEVVTYTCLSIYIADYLIMLFVLRRAMFGNSTQKLNLFLILCALVEIVLDKSFSNFHDSALNSTKVLRLVRAMRMLRLIEKLSHVKELRRLLQMAANCGKSLCWSFLFCGCVLIMWAVVAVELVHPVVRELSAIGQWEDCAECADAFSSVLLSTLTFFKTTIAGDSWGLLAEPVIRHSPGLACIFVGASMSIVYGALTLSNAVVVDSFAEQRQKDEKMIAEEMRLDEELDIKYWRSMFERLDEDKSGALDLDEIIGGAKRFPNFRNRLRVMDIDEQDLEQLFGMLDADGGGTIDPDEFITALSRWRLESKTAARFTKFNMMRMMRMQEDLIEKVERLKQQTNQQGRKTTELFERQASSSRTNDDSNLLFSDDQEWTPPVNFFPRESHDSDSSRTGQDVLIEQPRQSGMQRVHQQSSGSSFHIFSQLKQLIHQLEQDFGRSPASMVSCSLEANSSGSVACDVGQTKQCSVERFASTKETPQCTPSGFCYDHGQDVKGAVGSTAAELGREHSQDRSRVISEGSMALENVRFQQLEEPFDAPLPPPALHVRE